jgi:hypothetical protein
MVFAMGRIPRPAADALVGFTSCPSKPHRGSAADEGVRPTQGQRNVKLVLNMLV